MVKKLCETWLVVTGACTCTEALEILKSKVCLVFFLEILFVVIESEMRFAVRMCASSVGILFVVAIFCAVIRKVVFLGCRCAFPCLCC